MSSTNPNCPLCGGTGGYRYDENHGTTCRLCCPHKTWYIQSDNQPNPNEITCSMCGYEPRNEPWRVFDPNEPLVKGAEYRILWTKTVKGTPFMPDPKVDTVVHEGTATFGRHKPGHGAVAHVKTEDRLMHKDSTYEVDPSTVIAISRLL